jgi:hypothetical protein
MIQLKSKDDGKVGLPAPAQEDPSAGVSEECMAPSRFSCLKGKEEDFLEGIRNDGSAVPCTRAGRVDVAMMR